MVAFLNMQTGGSSFVGWLGCRRMSGSKDGLGDNAGVTEKADGW